MARKAVARHVEPEEISQDIPDEEPARVIDEEEPESNGQSGASKTDLIREAVQAGYEKPARGVEYIIALQVARFSLTGGSLEPVQRARIKLGSLPSFSK